MNKIILPEPEDLDPYTNAEERRAHQAQIENIQQSLVPAYDHVNDTLKVFTRAAMEGGDFCQESMLLHKFIGKLSSIRMSVQVGWINRAYLASAEQARAYGDKEGVEETYSEVFAKMALPSRPSALFAEIKTVLEPYTVERFEPGFIKRGP